MGGGRVRAFAVGLVAGLAMAAPAQAQSPDDPVPSKVLSGYFTVADGTELHYTARVPDVPNPDGWPTLLIYSGYGDTTGMYFGPSITEKEGYAEVMVGIRGTGCSGGEWTFMDPRHARDGYEAVEWAAHQPWSNGRVGLLGESYGGFMQFPVAALQPPHLVAMVPGAPFADAYRDVFAPGGIQNVTIAPFFMASQFGFQSASTESTIQRELAADPELAARCAAHQGEHSEAGWVPLTTAITHQYADSTIASFDPVSERDRIEVPMLVTAAWQDQILGPRGVETLAQLGKPFWATLTNGAHSETYAYSPVVDRTLGFLDHYVERSNPAFASEPRVQLLWETYKVPGGKTTANWTTGHPSWPPAATARRFDLAPGSRLVSPGQTIPAGADRYAYVPGAGEQLKRAYASQTTTTYSAWTPPAGGTYRAYTSAPLGQDLPSAGTASADLWIDSTAPDTDLQVTLTEVRGDQEYMVQRGWLRASHRKLDDKRSTVFRPFHTHLETDAQPLKLGVAEKVRVEIRPYAHLFRAGSRVRLWVAAPSTSASDSGWAFASFPAPAVNQIHHGLGTPSALVLPELERSGDTKPAPACGQTLLQACRPDPLGAS